MLNVKEIMEILPHRYPFLLIDRVEEIEEGKKVVAYKNVTINEPYCIVNLGYGSGIHAPGICSLKSQVKASLNVLKANGAAIRLYKKYGFTVTDTKVNHDTKRYVCEYPRKLNNTW